MGDDSYRKIKMLLASPDPEKLLEGLKLAGIEIAKVGSREARPLFEMVSALFYIDPLDRPELVPVLDEAVNLAARLGRHWIIPVLLEGLNAGDLKAQWAIAHVLGRIGSDAIAPMMRTYASTKDRMLRIFILYAMGKIKSAEVVMAAPMVLEAARSPDLEERDTATRTLGKLMESIPSGRLSEELNRQFLERLRANLADANASVRAKAVRSLGKMARYKHLAASDCEQLEAACRRILGTDERNDWDRAFVVRKEAEEALKYFCRTEPRP
jgi:HEAT repeat protein